MVAVKSCGDHIPDIHVEAAWDFISEMESVVLLCKNKATPTLSNLFNRPMGRIRVQVLIYRRLRIGRDSHLDQSEPYDIS